MKTIGVVCARAEWFREWAREIACQGGATFVPLYREADTRGHAFDLVICIGDSRAKCADGSSVYELLNAARRRVRA